MDTADPRRPHTRRTETLPFAAALLAAALLTAAPHVSAQTATVTGFVQTGFNTTVAGSPFGSLPIVPPVGGPDATFQVVQARVYVRGQVDERFGYAVQSNFAGGFRLLTAYATWRVSDRMSVQVGQMLKPFGQDRTLPRHQLTSFDRAMTTLRLVNNLRYGDWDIGAMARIGVGETGDLSVGVFNGNGTGAGTTSDADDAKNVVARLRMPIGSQGESSRTVVGISLSSLRLAAAADGKKDHLAWGVDGRIERGSLAFSAEVLSAEDYGWLQTRKALGYVLTVERALSPLAGARSTSVALRMERFDPDTGTDDDEILLLVPNLNLAVSDAGRFQVGLVMENPSAGGVDNAISAVALMQVNFF